MTHSGSLLQSLSVWHKPLSAHTRADVGAVVVGDRLGLDVGDSVVGRRVGLANVGEVVVGDADVGEADVGEDVVGAHMRTEDVGTGHVPLATAPGQPQFGAIPGHVSVALLRKVLYSVAFRAQTHCK